MTRSHHPARGAKVLRWVRTQMAGKTFSSKEPAKELNLEPFSVGIELGRLEYEGKGVRKAGRNGEGGTVWEVVAT